MKSKLCRVKKLFAVLLIISILVIQIDYTKKNAEAFAVAVIPIVDVAPEIIAAIMTLIAGGMVVHSDDMALTAAQAYLETGQAIGTLSNGVVTITSAAATAASEWLQTYITTITAETGTYTQTVGATMPATDPASIDWTASSDATLFNAVPINDGINYINITNFQGIRDWILDQTGQYPDDGRYATFIMTAINSYQTLTVKLGHDYIEIMDANWISNFIMYSTELASVSKFRFWLDRRYDADLGADTVQFNIQTYDDVLGKWVFPSDCPFITGLNPEGISLRLKTDTALPISTEWDIPITLDPTDITYNPAEPTDRTVAIPTDWTGVLDQTIDDISDPTEIPDDPITEPTSILDWLAKLWAWIQEFWAWIKSIPQLIADAIAAEFVIGPNDTIDYSKLKFAAELFTNKFPFSLPWDLKNMIATFGAGTTAAPVIPIGINGITTDIDLSKFNSLAAAVRVLELFAFTGGLLFGTRKLLGGAS